MKFNKLSNKKGFILGEVLMAILLLAVSAAVVGGIINTSLKNAQFSRNFVIAESLASETIENITSIRNTNWLLHPGNKSCWLLVDPSGECPGNSAQVGTYYITSQSGSGWILVDGPEGGIDLESTQSEFYRLFLVPFDNTKMYKDSQNYADDGEASEFYREVVFDSISGDDTQAAATVTIKWKEGAKDRQVSRSFILYNF